jgi:hypothetical protein
LNNWAALFEWIDLFFDFFLRFKVWGIPVMPVMIAVLVLGIVLDYVLISAREEG